MLLQVATVQGHSRSAAFAGATLKFLNPLRHNYSVISISGALSPAEPRVTGLGHARSLASLPLVTAPVVTPGHTAELLKGCLLPHRSGVRVSGCSGTPERLAPVVAHVLRCTIARGRAISLPRFFLSSLSQRAVCYYQCNRRPSNWPLVSRVLRIASSASWRNVFVATSSARSSPITLACFWLGLGSMRR